MYAWELIHVILILDVKRGRNSMNVCYLGNQNGIWHTLYGNNAKEQRISIDTIKYTGMY